MKNLLIAAVASLAFAMPNLANAIATTDDDLSITIVEPASPVRQYYIVLPPILIRGVPAGVSCNEDMLAKIQMVVSLLDAVPPPFKINEWKAQFTGLPSIGCVEEIREEERGQKEDQGFWFDEGKDFHYPEV